MIFTTCYKIFYKRRSHARARTPQVRVQRPLHLQFRTVSRPAWPPCIFSILHHINQRVHPHPATGFISGLSNMDVGTVGRARSCARCDVREPGCKRTSLLARDALSLLLRLYFRLALGVHAPRRNVELRASPFMLIAFAVFNDKSLSIIIIIRKDMLVNKVFFIFIWCKIKNVYEVSKLRIFLIKFFLIKGWSLIVHIIFCFSLFTIFDMWHYFLLYRLLHIFYFFIILFLYIYYFYNILLFYNIICLKYQIK